MKNEPMQILQSEGFFEDLFFYKLVGPAHAREGSKKMQQIFENWQTETESRSPNREDRIVAVAIVPYTQKCLPLV
jgi:hypothetical protein